MAFSPESRLTRRSLLQLAGGAGIAVVGGPATLGLTAATVVQIAAVADSSGAGAVYGAPVLKGMRLATAEINAHGGINGHALHLHISDGRSDPTAIAALVNTAGRHISTVALLGPTLSSEAVIVDPIAQAAGLPVLAVSNTVPGLTRIGNYIFRLPLGDDRIIPVVLRKAHSQFHFKRPALLYDDVNTATAAAGKVFRDDVASIGLTLVATETFTSGATQFSRGLATIGAAKPDVILVSALAQDAVHILKQRLQSGIPATTPVIGANGLNTPAIIQGAGLAADGVIVGTIFDPTGAQARNRHFRAAFRTRYRHAPDVFAAQGYDGVYTVATALRHTNTTANRRALRAALATLNHVPSVLSATGQFSMTANREANLEPTVQIVRNGRFVHFP